MDPIRSPPLPNALRDPLKPDGAYMSNTSPHQAGLGPLWLGPRRVLKLVVNSYILFYIIIYYHILLYIIIY